MSRKYPKVGFAFSGSSSRSIFYIGFLEVLKENAFPIDFISAMSGAAIIAAAYSCGTMNELKKIALKIDKEFIFNLIERSKGRGGIYNLDRVEEQLRIFTRNLNFEDVSPRLAFVATDIIAGEEVVLQVGDIARSVCASCALPAVFEPVKWGNKSLVDGGVVNVLPGNVAADAGMDLVIGIDLRNTRHVFSRWQIQGRRIINAIKRILWPNQAEQVWQKISHMLDYTSYFQGYPIVNQLENSLEYPNMFAVLGRTLDIAIKAQQHDNEAGGFTRGCDLVIVPETPQVPWWRRAIYMRFSHIGDTTQYYLSGRKTAEEYLPQMWQLLINFEKQQKEVNIKIAEILIEENESGN